MRSNRAISLALLMSVGCGPAAGPSVAPGETESAAAGVTVSITDAQAAEPEDGTQLGQPAESSPLQPAHRVADLLKTIRELNEQPLPQDPKEAQTVTRQRNHRIVDIATQAAQLCVSRSGQTPKFRLAIQARLEALYQLAIGGSPDDVDRLYADVRTLNENDPSSVLAAEGVYYLAKFAHAMARTRGTTDERWLTYACRRAQEFADRSADQDSRAAALLLGTGRLCEVQALLATTDRSSEQLMVQARSCYVALTGRFADTPQAREAAAVLRRLDLPGHRLQQFGGPTLDGGFLSETEFAGHPTVIYFWEVDDPDVRTFLLPLLKKADQSSEAGVRLVGVNLDSDEAALRDFLQTNGVPGRQIFFADDRQRGWNSPLVRFWGISRSGNAWLLNRDGRVVAVDVSWARLEHHLAALRR
ncbi:MAG: TlpA disulfide reductase family protein [Fuerstiella sp.]